MRAISAAMKWKIAIVHNVATRKQISSTLYEDRSRAFVASLTQFNCHIDTKIVHLFICYDFIIIIIIIIIHTAKLDCGNRMSAARPSHRNAA